LGVQNRDLLGAVLLADMPEFVTEIEAAKEEYDPWETVGEAAAWVAAAGAAAAWAAPVGAVGAAEEAAGASEEVDGAVVEALDWGAAGAAAAPADEAEEAEKPAESQVH
jgi:hypothetical protein